MRACLQAATACSFMPDTYAKTSFTEAPLELYNLPPFYILGEIVVSLVNDGALQVLSTDGKPLRHIPLPFTKSSKVFAPEAITVDSNDNILMADSMRNCLLVFSGEDGHLIAECARESLCNPYGVAVDRVGRVIMTDSSNQIKIF